MHFQRGMRVRVKATGALAVVAADYGPRVYPPISLVDDSRLYTHDELEPVPTNDTVVVRRELLRHLVQVAQTALGAPVVVPDQQAIDEAVELLDPAVGPCILTGAEGENPDDCTTHDHEEP